MLTYLIDTIQFSKSKILSFKNVPLYFEKKYIGNKVSSLTWQIYTKF